MKSMPSIMVDTSMKKREIGDKLSLMTYQMKCVLKRGDECTPFCKVLKQIKWQF